MSEYKVGSLPQDPRTKLLNLTVHPDWTEYQGTWPEYSHYKKQRKPVLW